MILTPHDPTSTLPDYGVLLVDAVDGGWTAGISLYSKFVAMVLERVRLPVPARHVRTGLPHF